MDVAANSLGTLERFLTRAYVRLGRHFLTAYALFLLVTVEALGALYLAVGSRYVVLVTSDLVRLGLVLGLGIAAAIAVGAWSLRSDIRILIAWVEGARAPHDALVTWSAALALPARLARWLVTMGALLTLIVLPYGVAETPLEWGGAAAAAVMILLLTVWAAVFHRASSELALRPLLREAAARLPPIVQEAPLQHSIRTRLLLALPVMSLTTTIVAVGFAPHHPSIEAFVETLGIALVVTLTMTLGLSLAVTQSILEPIAELLQATRRMRAGDLGTPARILSADEHGVLTRNFNVAMAGLAERERLREDLKASRARIVTASDAARRQVERDLHDGAQQHLVMAQLKLGAACRALEGASAAALVAEVAEDLTRAIAELRELAHGIYPAVLESDGLGGALAEAAERSVLPVQVACEAGRYAPEVEAAVYFCCLEALQNAAKHAGEGARVSVALAEADGRLRFEIADDGRGFAGNGAASGAGVQNMADRIGALGGTVTIESAPGRGTRVAGRLPVGGQPRR